MELIADTFVNLLTNGLVFITAILGGSFGLAILVFTLVTRVLMYPLTAKQLRSSRAMQNLQPKIKEIQEKHKNDRARLQREQMALFKQAGVNPVGCLGPMIIQLPIFIALFYAIRKALADTPESLVSLSSKLYDWLPIVGGEIPLNSKFLGVDMGLTPSDEGGAAIVLFPLLVGGSTYVVQKMISTQSSDARQQSMTSMMTWMMPIMLGFWTIGFPIGLAFYWISSNIVSVALQYRVMGWGGLARKPAPIVSPTGSGGSVIEGSVVRKDDAVKEDKSEIEPEADGQVEKDAEGTLVPELRRSTLPPDEQRTGGTGLGAFLKKILLGNPPPPPTQAPPSDPSAEVTPEGSRYETRDSDGRSRVQREDSRRSDREGEQAPRGGRNRPKRRRGGGRR